MGVIFLEYINKTKLIINCSSYFDSEPQQCSWLILAWCPSFNFGYLVGVVGQSLTLVAERK